MAERAKRAEWIPGVLWFVCGTHLAIVILVHQLDNLLDLSLGQLLPTFCQSCDKLIKVDLAAPVRVKGCVGESKISGELSAEMAVQVKRSLHVRPPLKIAFSSASDGAIFARRPNESDMGEEKDCGAAAARTPHMHVENPTCTTIP